VPRAEGVPVEATDLRYRVVFETQEGDITCHLDHEEAPQAAANFIALARGQRVCRDSDTKEIVERRFYDGLTFHRTIRNFIIQTGNPGTGASAGPGWTIAREEGNQARYDAPGAMGMVDAGEDTHGSQFFITLRGQASLKGKYSPFGLCDSEDVIQRIASGEKQAATAKGKSATKPVNAVRLTRARVLRVLPDPPEEAPTPETPAPAAAPAP